MPVLSRSAACAVALLALGACDPRFVHKSDLSAREIVALSGTWSGKASLSFSSSSRCPRTYLLDMQITQGNVSGTVVDAQTPDAPPSTFTTFVEYDGSMHAAVRTKGRDLAMLGTFNRDGFRGTARSADCNYTVVMLRRGDKS